MPESGENPGRSADLHLEVTQLLDALSQRDPQAAGQLLPIVYEELRRLAARHFRGQPADHTLQPTALVHEAFLKLADQSGARWTDRAHFFAVAATAMRQILINHALAQQAAKRGGPGRRGRRVDLEETILQQTQSQLDMLALDEVLQRLAKLDSRKHRVVELRFFAGLSADEVAEVLGVSKSTIESDWRAARAWLNAELSRE